MESLRNSKLIKAIKKALQNNDPAFAAAIIKEDIEKENNASLNIAITGKAGSGKSTFLNAFRGIGDKDEGAAPTGCKETTMEVKRYPHPKYHNVTLWDLPGIGTTRFQAAKYLKLVGFEKFDFFIIISDTRFRKNDAKLAKEIQRMGKKFYFVRSKIDVDSDQRRSNYNEERTLSQIREYCIKSLQEQGFESPQVFLVSSFDLHLYDFQLLEETLERELPEHKRDALLMAIPNISLEIINKKKEALQAKIKFYAAVSALIASVPVGGLSFATDVSMLVAPTNHYQVTFGLDIESLCNLALSTRVPLEDLKAAMTSPLGTNEITKELIVKLLCFSVSDAALMAAEEGFRYIPLFGIPAAMVASFASTYSALNRFLNMLAEDAERVFKTALRLDTSE